MKFNHVRPDLKEYKLKQVNEDGRRFYETPNGNKYPSVTTVLAEHSRQAIAEWRARVGEEAANKKSTQASGRGTRIHKLCEDYIDNKPIIYKNPIDQSMFSSMIPILNNINNVHCQEHKMYSDHLRLAGTVDCIGEYEGRLSIIDFKTAEKAKRTEWIHNYFMQCSAYAIMYEELYNEPISNIVVIIGVDNDYPQVFQEKRDNWTKQLLEYRNIYENRQKNVDLVL